MRVGVAVLARPTFDVPFAEVTAALAWDRLVETGHDLIGSPNLLLDAPALDSTVDGLSGEALDALVLVQATFADASLAGAIAAANPAPLLMWAIPEERTGGRLRLNSFCGINLAGYRLARSGRPYRWLYRHPDELGVVESLREVLGSPAPRRPDIGEPPDVTRLSPEARSAAAGVLSRLSGTKVGIVGEHPVGFEPCAFDAAELDAAIGARAETATLPELFVRAESADSQQAVALRQQVGEALAGVDDVDQAELDRSLRLHLGLRSLVEERGWSAVATRCWPECFTEFGGACCSPHSLLNDSGVPGCCEADAFGTVTSLILQWLADGPAFVADLVDVDLAGDTGVFWHCGMAPLAMATEDPAPRATVHSNRGMPLLNEFALKPGRVSIARLSQSRGVIRLTIGGGVMLAEPLPFSGTAGVVRFDRPTETILDTVMTEGHEHHYGIVYGDVREELRAVAALADLPVIEL